MAQRTCSIEGCDNPHHGRGLCNKHLRRWRKGHLVCATTVRKRLPPECSEDGCEKPCYALDRCYKHYVRVWRRANHAAQRRRERDWYDANREDRIKNRREWLAANRAERQAYERTWRAKNPERVREIGRRSAARRRAREQTVFTLPFSAEQLAERLAFWGNCCWKCGVAASEIDHVKPIKVGGPHILANIRPICPPCNKSKAATWEPRT